MSKGYINVTAVGNLGKDPEVRATGSGVKVATFSIAVDQGYGDKARTEWVNVLCFDKLAELAEKYLKKGKGIALSGTLQTSSWEDKQSGQKRYKTEVVARDIVFMDSGAGSGAGGGQKQGHSHASQPARQQTQQQTRGSAPQDTRDASNAWEESDGDIPF